MSLSSYHLAWLSAHPERTAEWLSARLADGFHVHHVDGDHSNDAPLNLVLIEGIDHNRIVHGWTRLKVLGHNREAGKKGGSNSRRYVGKRKAKQLARKASAARWGKKPRSKGGRPRKRKWWERWKLDERGSSAS